MEQYLPTTHKLWAQIHYYAIGIFQGAEHPFRKSRRRKHNPLQALTYLVLKIMIFPAIWITGLLLLSYSWWPTALSANLTFGRVAIIHTVAAFAMLIFFFVHVYMTTVGHTIFHHIKSMITGYDPDVVEEIPAPRELKRSPDQVTTGR